MTNDENEIDGMKKKQKKMKNKNGISEMSCLLLLLKKKK